MVLGMFNIYNLNKTVDKEGKYSSLFTYFRYTKLGFSGNNEPSFVFPTAICTRESVSSSGRPNVSSKPSFLSSNLASKRGIEDLDFLIGDEAIAQAKTMALNYPIRHGQISNWDHMERFWEQSIFKYLRCEPEDHYFLLVRKSKKIQFQQTHLVRLNHL